MPAAERPSGRSARPSGDEQTPPPVFLPGIISRQMSRKRWTICRRWPQWVQA